MVATTLEQSKELMELGVDPSTADMVYVPISNNPKEYDLTVNIWSRVDLEPDWIPAWSLTALLDCIKPKRKGDEVCIHKTLNENRYTYFATMRFYTLGGRNYISKEYADPFNALYDVILRYAKFITFK